MAFDILTIPGMSAECERAFSQAKLLITDSRNHLLPPTVQACECLKQWIRRGHIPTFTLTAEDEIEQQRAKVREKEKALQELAEYL